VSSWQKINQKRGYLYTKNAKIENFFISSHISIYKFIASEKPAFFDQMRKFALLRGTPALWDAPLAIPSGSFFREIRDARYASRNTNIEPRNTTYASRNTVQSKLNDYAKQTQFPKCPNGCKLSKDND
jgi:hypothetical protein